MNQLTRREALLTALFGTGLIGLRAMATGLPAWFLQNPGRATAREPFIAFVCDDSTAEAIRPIAVERLGAVLGRAPADVMAHLYDTPRLNLHL